jgi:hypothetical protein
LNSGVINWIFKKSFNGSKSDYWDILNFTVYLFYYHIFRTENKIRYHFFRKWFRKRQLSFTSGTTSNYFEGVTEWRNEQEFKNHLNVLTYTKLYNKVLEIEDIEIQENFIIICIFLFFYR